MTEPLETRRTVLSPVWRRSQLPKNADPVETYSPTKIIVAHGKHIVGESKHSSNDLFESFLTGFTKDSSTKLEGSEIGRELVF